MIDIADDRLDLFRSLYRDIATARLGSRELDVRVWALANGEGQPLRTVGPPTYDRPRYFCNPSADVDWIGYDLLKIAPLYTSSLDAAFGFVPENWYFTDIKQMVGPDISSVRWWVHLMRRNDRISPVCSASVGTNGDRFYPRKLALAVTAVALNARYSEEVGRDVYVSEVPI